MLKKIIFVLLIFSHGSLLAQDNLFDNVSLALKSGSSKELSKYLHSTVEINLDGDKANFSNTHAEIYLKDFFKKNPPLSFEYVHKGSSREGLKYAIGTYTCSSGIYRVVIRVKKFEQDFSIYIIDFLKE